MRILTIADLHIGSIKEIAYVYNIVTDIIEKEIIFNKTDLVVFLGDYFDKLFKVNEEYVSLAINIMSYLVNACQKSKTKIRMIYGTESHEMNQYKLFNYHLTSSNVDMKIYDTVTEECIDGKNILFIPEEYINNKYKHYAKYFTKKYDFVFGHGIIEDGMPSIVSYSNENNKNNEKQVPRFKSGELSNISDICVFGHYHTYTDMHNNVYYLGSLFRNSFGEEEAKGYGIIEEIDDEYQLRFVENTDAYVYKTINFNIDDKIYKDANSIMNEIQKIKDEYPDVFNGNKIGKIRLVFNDISKIDDNFKENLKTILFNDKHIASMFKDIPTNNVINELDDDDDEWSFILDNSLAIEDKIFQYINKVYDNPMDMETLMKYISKSINAIKAEYDREASASLSSILINNYLLFL